MERQKKTTTIVPIICMLTCIVLSFGPYSYCSSLPGEGREGFRAVTPSSPQPSPSDTLLFQKICSKLKKAQGDYTIAGVINMTDPVTPQNSIKNAAFTFCKQGDEFYYSLGATETINGREVYLYIDHRTQHILLSPRKNMVYDPSPVKPIDLGEAIRSEHYSLGSVTNGPLQTLTLLNERHISCKQYSVTFTREGLNITRLFMRLTDIQDPLNRDKETTVDVKITKWEQAADVSKYTTPGRIVAKTNNGWKTTNEFKNYKLIEM